MTALRNLHRRLLRLLALAGAACMFAAPVIASFDDVAAGVRAAGMADAQVAVADDASAAFNNPAGLIQVGDRRIATEFGTSARGLSDGSELGHSYLGYTHPIVPGETVLGAAVRTFKASDVLQERTYLIGAGRRLRIAPFGWEGVWSAGANMKLLERSFESGSYGSNAIGDSGSAVGAADPLLNGGGKSTAFGLDAGLLYEFGRKLDSSIGLMMMNANRPDISLGAGDRAPQMLKIGAAHRPAWGLVTAEIRRARRLTGRPDTDVALGAERNFRLSNHGAVTLRGGYAEGSRGYQALTAGAAYHFGRFSFDYAVSFPIGNLSITDGGQRLGFSMRFGMPAVRASSSTSRAILPPMALPDESPAIEVSILGSTSAATARPATPAVSTPEPAKVLEDALRGMEKMKDKVESDMETIRREMEAIRKATEPPARPSPTAAPTPSPRPTPARVAPKPEKKPAAIPATRPAARTAPKPSPEAERDWQFYREAVNRDVSDAERIEILESMLMKYGEGEAARINRELEKLRKRAQ